MRLTINILFLADSEPRNSIIAECTVAGISLRTGAPAVAIPLSNNVFEWPDRSGLLEFGGLDPGIKDPIRVGFFDLFRGDEEYPLGFCDLSGRAGFETVPIQRPGSSASETKACFEIRWVPDDGAMASGGLFGTVDQQPETNEYGIAVHLNPPQASLPLSSDFQSTLERFQFSYVYCRCLVQSDPFISASCPRFSPIVDTFRLRATAKDVMDMLESTPIVIRLESSTRGVIAIAAISFKHQSARTLHYLWKRSDSENIAEICASVQLLNIAGRGFLPASNVYESEKQDIPPPPPPSGAPSSALVVRTLDTSALALREQRLQEQVMIIAKVEREVEQLRATLQKREIELDKREKALDQKRKEESDRARASVKHAEERAKKAEAELTSKTAELQKQIDHGKTEVLQLQREARKLRDDIKALHEKHAQTDIGMLERDLSRERGINEGLREQLRRAQEERRILEDEIRVLTQEISETRAVLRRSADRGNNLRGPQVTSRSKPTRIEVSSVLQPKQLPRPASSLPAPKPTSRPRPDTRSFTRRGNSELEQQLQELIRARDKQRAKLSADPEVLRCLDEDIARISHELGRS